MFQGKYREGIMSTQSDNFEFHLPVSLYFGVDSLQKIPQICRQYGTNVLLVTAIDLKQIEKEIIPILEQANFLIDKFYLDSPEPTCVFIDLSAKELATKNYDCIIGLGGGSAIDMAKSLSIALTNPEQIWAYANLSTRPPKPIKNKTIPIIAIPTTAGTGSEVTPYAVLTNPETNQKGTIQEVEIFPKVAIIDPNLMISMPTELTTSTGIDAFAHALESCLNISKSSPVSELVGVEAMRLIFQFLPQVLQQPSSLTYRTNMALASTLAGIAIAHRGTTTAHAIAETLGGLTKIPHGHCVTISTLPTLKMTVKKTKDKFAAFYDLLNWKNEKNLTNNEKAEYFVLKVEELIKEINMERNVRYYDKKTEGLNEKLLNHMLQNKFRPLNQHIVQFSREELLTIINEIIGDDT